MTNAPFELNVLSIWRKWFLKEKNKETEFPGRWINYWGDGKYPLLIW